VARLGESGSPKRVREVFFFVCVVEYSSRRGLGVVLSECVARPGEGISPKRDNVTLWLF